MAQTEPGCGPASMRVAGDAASRLLPGSSSYSRRFAALLAAFERDVAIARQRALTCPGDPRAAALAAEGDAAHLRLLAHLARILRARHPAPVEAPLRRMVLLVALVVREVDPGMHARHAAIRHALEPFLGLGDADAEEAEDDWWNPEAEQVRRQIWHACVLVQMRLLLAANVPGSLGDAGDGG